MGKIDSCLVMTPYFTMDFVVGAHISALQFTRACHCFISTEQNKILSFSFADGIGKSGAAWVNWQWSLGAKLLKIWL